ncbi:TonB-dependent receptor domain-containing protein [Mangrovimonas sp. YM274]|uniref:TonB-dependent receptor domain-containing protein n=1 Tax=Mangrovimonas sp. YM274 TaxID=3070660 RepID=UPI0035A6FF75
MKLKDFSMLFNWIVKLFTKEVITIFCVVLCVLQSVAQHKVSGMVTDSLTKAPVGEVEIYDKLRGLITTTDAKGHFEFQTNKSKLTLVFFSLYHDVLEKELAITKDVEMAIELSVTVEELTAVQINSRRAKAFALERLEDVEGTAIYAGKKTEVVLVDQSMANLATNNARQIYSEVAGLNIYQNDDAGLQLNIGGRGLDPNRTSNFNTRQNGYDISADVLGYPESYYTPAAEGLKEIQVVRGAASLQYGTQFGGLVNFVMKEPNANKPFELITRNTLGSFGLYTNFTSIGGTKDKLSYYGYFNYKKGDGFRPNSEFESKNAYMHLGYQLTDKTKLTGELTHLHYLAQQGGGLSDGMFAEDAYQSNRERNWFQVDWWLYNLTLSHQFSENTNYTFSAFGLNASRYALGFRENRVSQADNLQERDLIKSEFNNFGFETRLLHKYLLGDTKSTFLIGGKFYKANNSSEQGPGSDGFGPDFDFYLDDYPTYQNQSAYTYPNLNVAAFGENIFYFNEKFSITPGFRFEYINTGSEGFYKEFSVDGAGNIDEEITHFQDETRERSFVLLGLGASYKPVKGAELYANISQNYRSVTFADISIFNPSFSISPDISDEKGFTTDVGLRGRFKDIVSYDVGGFAISYRDRIGIVLKEREDGKLVSERGNVGNALIFGMESLIDVNLNNWLIDNNDLVLSCFFNGAFISSEYTSSEETGVVGNEVEFIPAANIKTGLNFGYKNFLSRIQYTYLGAQFTDATNAETDEQNESGVSGMIPSYDILDVSLSYSYKRFKLEAGVNNVLDNVYFTRRATGYPGPGIIPSAPRNWYTSLQIRL